MNMNSPALQQQIAMLDQEYAQRKSDMVRSFYAQQQNVYQQNVPAPVQSQTAQNVNWIQVSGIDGAKNQIVQPGQTAWMMDNNQPYFYVKSVDGVGTSSLRIFQFAEVQDVAPEQTTQPQIDLSDYVPRGEFDALKAQVEQLATKQTKLSTKENNGVEDNG